MQEIIPKFSTELRPSKELHIPTIVLEVKNMGFDFKGKMIFVYDFKQKCYVFCGTDPDICESLISAEEKKVSETFKSGDDKIQRA